MGDGEMVGGEMVGGEMVGGEMGDGEMSDGEMQISSITILEPSEKVCDLAANEMEISLTSTEDPMLSQMEEQVTIDQSLEQPEAKTKKKRNHNPAITMLKKEMDIIISR